MSAGRNDPCPCGSGLRFKHCHGRADGAIPPPPERTGGIEEARQFLAAGRRDEAIALAEATLARDPANVEALRLLGTAAIPTDPQRARAAWERVLARAKGDAEAHFNLGNLDRAVDDRPAALAHFEAALAQAPDHAGIQNNLGLTRLESGDATGAAACFDRVLAAQPGHVDALANRAIVHQQLGEHAEADALHERLFALRSDWPVELWVQRAIAAQKTGALERAAEFFAVAARRAPDNAIVQANLGSALVELRRFAEADLPLARALDLDPRATYVKSMLAHARAQRCAWEGIDALFASIGADLATEVGSPASPFPLLAMPLAPEALRTAARRWARQIATVPARPRPPVRRRGSGRLRVGFVSSDLRDHPMVHLSVEFWERLDRARVETFAYCLLPPDPGPVGQRAVRAFEHVRDITSEPLAQSAERIRSDGIDVLVDLNGYTTHGRPELFAQRPAPVLVNSIGFPGTLGAPWYDFIHVDPFGARPDVARHLDEACLVLPHASFPSDTTRAPHGAAPPRSAVGLPEDAFVYCCFNNSFKILPDVFDAWMRLLTHTPRSVLWLADTGAEPRANLARRAAAAGVDPARIVFAARVPVREHVARIAAADLVVDTYPYGAHTTANDALLAGVPVVTRAGPTLPSRIAASQLLAIGLPELVSWSAADCESLALELARDRARLEQLRLRLREERPRTALFDMARYATDYVAGLEDAWARVSAAP